MTIPRCTYPSCGRWLRYGIGETCCNCLVNISKRKPAVPILNVALFFEFVKKICTKSQKIFSSSSFFRRIFTESFSKQHIMENKNEGLFLPIETHRVALVP